MQKYAPIGNTANRCKETCFYTASQSRITNTARRIGAILGLVTGIG